MSWIMPRKRIERKAIKYRLQSCREGKMNIGVIGTGYVGLVPVSYTHLWVED